MLSTVRARVTLIALAAMFATLSLGAVALLLVLRQSLVDEIDRTISNRALDIAFEIDVTNELDNAGFPGDPETFVGIIERPGDGPILDIHNDDEPDARELVGLLVGDPTTDGSIVIDTPGSASVSSITQTEGADNLRIVFTEVTEGSELVVVARTLDGVDRTVSQVRTIALIAVPLLSLLVAALVYLLTGRALRPVDRMRAEVDSITAGDLGRRVEGSGRPDEISRLAGTMNSMLARLESAQSRQRRFASDAAHELRSPLASMRAQLDVDLAHPETVEWERSASHVRGELDRTQRMVEDLLILARSEDGSSMAVGQGLVDLDDLVLAEASSLAVPESITLGTSQVSAASVRGNADHLRRVVNNLVANAVRHATTMVVVSVAEQNGRAIVVVDDDGAGVPAEDRERIFERFVRLDEARSRDAGGSGLGLALAREIAAAHGGSLAATENERGGARFVLDLPAAG
jgi:signal transduction histidine kinase